MKQYLLFFAGILAILSSCNQAEIDHMQNQNDSLLAVINQGDASMNELLASFNAIEANLDSVAAKQGIITKGMDESGELKSNSADKINAQINDINNLMNENRKKIGELNKKLKAYSRENSQFKKSIALLTSRIESKDQELAKLNETLTAKNLQIVDLTSNVEALTAESEEKSGIIAEKTTKLNTAYYVIGTKKQLSDSNVIDRTGGLLGIGRSSSISENVDHSNFTKVDITSIKYIPVQGKKIMFITKHPAESFSLEYDDTDKSLVKGISIVSPEQFWSVSRYLVVQKD